MSAKAQHTQAIDYPLTSGDPAMNPYKQLKSIFKRLYHLHSIENIMIWDESVMMPEGAGDARANVMGTLNQISHKMLTQKKILRLINEAKDTVLPGAWDTANLTWMEKKHLNAVCVPDQLSKKMTEAQFISQQAWRKCRAENNWLAFLPHQEKTFQLVKEIAERKSQVLGLDPYDVLLDEYSPGFNQSMIDETFKDLKAELPPLIKKIVLEQKSNQTLPLDGPFAIDKQKKLATNIAKTLQFDFNCGRIDVSHHPFSSGNGVDTRITTRYTEDEFMSSISAIVHETGHGLYEQGLPKKWLFQPVGHVNSMAMHESQSLFMEMEVCRSQGFFQYLSPLINQAFGDLPAYSAENLYRLVTQVKPSLIRVDADEVTYPMHIVLRYEIEKDLMNGNIKISDLPAQWNELMMKYLDISTEDNFKDGVMQDVHWPSGAFGYFPSYTLGRLIAAQLFSTFNNNNTDFDSEISTGNFQTLHHWLQENIYQHASSLSADALIQQVTGESLNQQYFINRIKKRYLAGNRSDSIC